MPLTSEVHIEIVKKNGINIPVKLYVTQPFKILNVTENKREGILRLMMMSSSPGILDGDNYNIRVSLAKASSLELQTQSYQRLFSMNGGAALKLQVCLEDNAFFKYLPHPVVPHQGSDFVTSNKIYLSKGCTLIFGEVFTCGRKLNGEVFSFTRYQSVTEIFYNNRLVVKENLFMQPGVITANGLGQLEGFTHQATLIFLDEKAIVKPLIREISEFLDLRPDVLYGITSAPVNGIIIRLLGNKAEQLFDCLKEISLNNFRYKLHPDLGRA